MAMGARGLQAFYLFFNASMGIPYQEIAVIVGISPRATATRLTRARKMFAEEYQRLGSDCKQY
jgi:RNA polymerase sigma-70 factor (ECF subfamily)